MSTHPCWSRSILRLGLLALALVACGGGGGSAGVPAAPGAPTAFTYSEPEATYSTNEPIAANVPTYEGDASPFTVEPALPAGLELDPVTGLLSGTPLAPSPAREYVVRVGPGAGAPQATLRLGVSLSAADDLAPKASYSDDDIRHLLSRTGLGTGQVEQVRALGVPAWVDRMLEPQDTAALETEAAGLLVRAFDPPGLEGRFPNASQVTRYWLHLLIHSPQPFQELMALFWHDHFATSTEVLDLGTREWMVHQIALWRREATGNLRELLLLAARDPMMLESLNGTSNEHQGPNENFAREFWELFTLGVDNGYTQDDIVEAARAFTGYVRRDRDDGTAYVEFDPARHDPGEKQILGRVIPAQDVTDDYEAVVDITLAERPAAESVSRKLFEHFAFADPSPLPVDAMATLLREHEYELRPVLAALFTSEAFYSAPARVGLVKSPVEQVVGFVRSTGLLPADRKNPHTPDVAPPNLLHTLDADLERLEQRLGQPPSVEGWPVAEDWYTTQNAVQRANALLHCVTDLSDQALLGISIEPILPPPDARTSEQLLEAFASRLGLALTADETARYVQHLDSALEHGVEVSSPLADVPAEEFERRARGLLFVLSQHPDYALR